jgi:CheY-like chemotaxis protein
MDHMMPLMDGIETTQKLRALGYHGIIVALTANAITGTDQMFRENGFDDFISKPIDIRQLNACLNTYIRDRHIEESRKYKPETAQSQPEAINPKLFEVFKRDAEKAVTALRDNTSANNNMKLFTTAAHSMKSALANIGENEISSLAFALENAGLNGDREFISANAGNLIERLEALISSISPAETAAADDDVDIIEDTAYLAERLQIAREACEDYDRKAAYAALDLLKEKQWKSQTAAMLKNIREMLLLHSDFDEAEKQINAYLKNNGRSL